MVANERRCSPQPPVVSDGSTHDDEVVVVDVNRLVDRTHVDGVAGRRDRLADVPGDFGRRAVTGCGNDEDTSRLHDAGPDSSLPSPSWASSVPVS